MHPYTSDPRAFHEAQHDAAEATMRAHPAPERCDCPGHDVFLALAAVAASYAHEALNPGQTCGSCGYREPRYGTGHVLAVGHDPASCEDCSVSPGQLSAWDVAESDAAAEAVDGAVVERPDGSGGPAMFVAPWAPA